MNKLLLSLIWVPLALILVSCGGPNGIAPKKAKCAETKEQCQARKKAELDLMIADPLNKWITDGSHKKGQVTSGQRLQAYIGSIKQMDCVQLWIGELESGTAISYLEKGKIKSNSANGELVGKILLILAKQTKAVMIAEKKRICTDDGIELKPEFSHREIKRTKKKKNLWGF